jgi:hypothetical protein
MLIRSQDKKQLINTDMVTRIYSDKVEGGCKVRADFQNSWEDLGKYSSEAKAIKVLDMIQDLYDDRGRDFAWFNAHRTFQMPTNEEMEECHA